MRVTYNSVEKDEAAGRWRIQGMCFNDDGTPMTNDAGEHYKYEQNFPLDTLEWRAAEYDIDPSDTATLLDIVLAEAFMTTEDYADAPPNLYDTDDVSEARAGHIARCARVKLRHRLSRGGKQHPLRTLEAESPISQEVINAKKQVREKNRRQAKNLSEATSPLSDDHQRLAVTLAALSRSDIEEMG